MDYDDEESEWYECPACGTTWGQGYPIFDDEEEEEDYYEGFRVTFRNPFSLNTPNAEVLSAVEGEEFDIQEFSFGVSFPKQTCPICIRDKGKPPEELLLDKASTDKMALARVCWLINREATPITKEDVAKVSRRQLANYLELDKLYRESKEEEEDK